MRRRVVITGMGAITPVAHNVADLYKAQIEGRNGVGRISHFNASRFPTDFAAQVKDFELERFVPDCKRWDNSGVNSRFAAAAAQEALGDAGLLDNDKADPTRMGVYLGSGEGIQDFHHLMSILARTYDASRRPGVDTVAFARAAIHEFHAGREAEQELHTTSAHLAEQFNLQGPNFNCLTACAASSQAIGEATALIRHGDADVMLAGGAHSMIHPFGVTGFNLLTALSRSEEHTSELQSLRHLVCRLLLEKKKKNKV